MKHTLLSNWSFLERRSPSSAPRNTSSRAKTVLAFAWISALLWFTPTSANGQGICDRTPQVRDKLLELTKVSNCSDVTAQHLAEIRLGIDLEDVGISSLQAHDFSGLSSLHELILMRNSLSELPEGLFSDLRSLNRLWLSQNSLRELPEGIFNGLDSLVDLALGLNNLSRLPPGIFVGLSSLQKLSLIHNPLIELSEGIFNGLDSLVYLSLDFNNLSELPPGIFDDVLDTLGADANYSFALELSSRLKATLSFDSIKQIGLHGSEVSARVVLSRSLPVAVRVPYSVGGTATADRYKGLNPEPESGLLFSAGETTKEITFTLFEGEESSGKTIVLTLGELSRIGLRRSDGTGSDAPFLHAKTVLFPLDKDAEHTITIASANISTGVCDRTSQVRDKLMQTTEISTCEQVTLGHLAGVTRLDLAETGVTSLKQGDFRGLSNLQDLLLSRNRLTELPDEVFNGLRNLEKLWLQDNSLRELPEGIFDDIVDTLEDLRIDSQLKSRLLFHLTEQNVVEGGFVRVRVWLSRALPVAVRVPYTLGGTAAENHYWGLSVAPEAGLLFLAGERSQEISFTLSEEQDGLGRTVVLILGELTRIGLRRSDGGGADAPGLDSETLLDRPNDTHTHTITVSYPNEPAEVCERTPQVKDQLVQATEISTCGEITMADLSRVRHLDLRNSDIDTLQVHDFSGLSSLEYLWLRDNHLTGLPKDVFRGLNNLIDLTLQRNSLSNLHEGVFSGLSSLKHLYLNYNSLDTMPKQVFSGLSALERLWLQNNSLSELPEGIFHGLNSLQDLALYRNSLWELPPGIFGGLSNLEALRLWGNSLSVLSEGIFRGLANLELLELGDNDLITLPVGVFLKQNNLRKLTLASNPLPSLPDRVFDDVIDTLGGDYFVIGSRGLEAFETDTTTFRGTLTLPHHLKAELAFDSTEQKVLAGAVVTVPVSLSRELPVAVRVPYSVGFDGASGGYTNLSPAPDSGLLFPAGETRHEVSLTLSQDAAVRGERSLVLTLGKPTEIQLRRSDGQPPDAPYLESESLVLRSEDHSVHTVTVSDVDPAEQDPFCLSLWQGSRCTTVAILPHLFVGPLGEHLASTEVAVTHRDPEAAECEAALLFHRGTSPAPAVSFNGRFPDRNLFRTTLARGGAELLSLTAPDAGQLTSGALYVFARSPCHGGSLQVQARHLLESPSDRETEELFSVAGQSENDWLGDGDCRRLTALFGNGGDVGLATVTTRPGQSAPSGTRLRVAEFDLKGNLIGSLGSLGVSGQHQATSPWALDRPATIQMCLDVPGASDFQLAIDAMGTTAGGAKVQFSTVSTPGDTGPDDGGPSQ